MMCFLTSRSVQFTISMVKKVSRQVGVVRQAGVVLVARLALGFLTNSVEIPTKYSRSFSRVLLDVATVLGRALTTSTCLGICLVAWEVLEGHKALNDALFTTCLAHWRICTKGALKN